MSNAFTIKSFCITNNDALTDANPDYPAWFLRFLDILGLVETDDGGATQVTGGYAFQKLVNRTAFTEELIVVANAWDGYYSSIDENQTAMIYRLNKSKLDKMTDVRLLFKGNQMVKSCTPPIAGMAGYKADAAKIGALNTKATAYSDLLGAGEAIRKTSSGYYSRLKVDFKLIPAHLKKLDFMVRGVRYENPTLFATYLAARKKTDNAATHGTPYATITIPAQSYLQGAMFPYLENRVYRVVNKTGEIIFWGLSTNAAGYSGTFRYLGSKKSSMCTSKTLGPVGDILLFHNPSNNPVTVDIWMKE